MAPEERNFRSSPLKKAGTAVSVIILFLVITSVLFVLITPLFGWRTEIVLSGSMEPAIQTGSVVVSRPIAADDVREGDVIMFSSPDGHTLTTHRVIDVESGKDGLHVTTKGDANKGADINTVLPAQIVGIIVLSIPYLGYLVAFIRTPFGLVLFVVVPVAILIISELVKIYRSMD